METILKVRKLSKRYGKIRAVNELSLEVQRGQVFGILGPNGSGKSTTLGMVLDLVKPDQGDFEWFGKEPSKESRKRIGAVIETPNFFPYLSARQNLQIVAQIKEIDPADIDRVLKTVSLYERSSSKFRTFSFGMKQRLAVASALLGNPEVLILDEPTNGLDPEGIAQIREIVLLVASQGITIILASHLLDEVQKICNYVAVLRKGDILYTGDVSTVLAVSDCIELQSPDHEGLKAAIAGHPMFKSLVVSENKLLVYFTSDVAPQDVNQFLQQKGILLSHLSERKRSLEQHFLELLHDTK